MYKNCGSKRSAVFISLQPGAAAYPRKTQSTHAAPVLSAIQQGYHSHRRMLQQAARRRPRLYQHHCPGSRLSGSHLGTSCCGRTPITQPRYRSVLFVKRYPASCVSRMIISQMPGSSIRFLNGSPVFRMKDRTGVLLACTVASKPRTPCLLA
jgi:hypothetical protein